MGMIYVQKPRAAFTFDLGTQDFAQFDAIKAGVAAGSKAASMASNATIALCAMHSDTLDGCLPDDKSAVVGGMKAWRKAEWTAAFKDLCGSMLNKDERKAIAPYVTYIGTAFWHGVSLLHPTEERCRTLAEIKEELAAFSEPEDGASILIKAVNSIAPMKDNAIRLKWNAEDAAIAAASLTPEQRRVVAELALCLFGSETADDLKIVSE
jgi:hypothetical protein